MLSALHTAAAYSDEFIRVAPDLIFANMAGAGFGIADPAGAGARAGAKCS